MCHVVRQFDVLYIPMVSCGLYRQLHNRYLGAWSVSEMYCAVLLCTVLFCSVFICFAHLCFFLDRYSPTNHTPR